MLALSTHSANEGSSWDLLVNLSFSPPLPCFPPLFLSLLLFGVSRGEADKGIFLEGMQKSGRGKRLPHIFSTCNSLDISALLSYYT